MADLLTKVRRDIDRRLVELRPLVDEVRRLEQARDALASPSAAQRRPRARRATSPPGRTRLTKAQSQEIDRRVLALLSEESAQKPAALAMLTETSLGSMNSRLTRLAREGRLKKRKRGNAIRYEVPPAAA